jgi:hypothetical protein
MAPQQMNRASHRAPGPPCGGVTRLRCVGLLGLSTIRSSVRRGGILTDNCSVIRDMRTGPVVG